MRGGAGLECRMVLTGWWVKQLKSFKILFSMTIRKGKDLSDGHFRTDKQDVIAIGYILVPRSPCFVHSPVRANTLHTHTGSIIWIPTITRGPSMPVHDRIAINLAILLFCKRGKWIDGVRCKIQSWDSNPVEFSPSGHDE